MKFGWFAQNPRAFQVHVFVRRWAVSLPFFFFGSREVETGNGDVIRSCRFAAHVSFLLQHSKQTTATLAWYVLRPAQKPLLGARGGSLPHNGP